MAYSFFSNPVDYTKFHWIINIKQCIGHAYVILFWVLWICVFQKYFLTKKMVISLDEMKSFVLTERKTYQEISNILEERYSNMRGLSAMDVRRFCNENGIRICLEISLEYALKLP